MIVHVSHTDAAVTRIALAAFPDYSGRKFAISTSDRPLNCASYWDGGSRSYFRFVRLADLKVSEQVPAQSAFDRPVSGIDSVALPDGIVCVEHSIFCGKDSGLTIHARPENVRGLLPAPVELSWSERVVLHAICSLKSSYAGIPDYRRHEARARTGITDTEYSAALESLQARGFVNKSKAVTVAGRNARGSSLYWPKREQVSA